LVPALNDDDKDDEISKIHDRCHQRLLFCDAKTRRNVTARNGVRQCANLHMALQALPVIASSPWRLLADILAAPPLCVCTVRRAARFSVQCWHGNDKRFSGRASAIRDQFMSTRNVFGAELASLAASTSRMISYAPLIKSISQIRIFDVAEIAGVITQSTKAKSMCG